MSELVIYNSLTRKKEKFTPLRPGHINLYVCGVTVYDDCHLGHARSMVAFDVIVRFLKSQAYVVRYVRNITDIDDKIIQRAKDLDIPIDTITQQYSQAMQAMTTALYIDPPDVEPRATQYVNSMIALIEQLLNKDYAYINAEGDVCFEVSKFQAYGALMQQDLSALIAGTRVDVVESKRSPLDFVLWKAAKSGEPQWPAPWGAGRPGWHIECSAMAMQELGSQIDIHGGGVDLQFPHHENEIAQCEAITAKRFANYWLHVGLLQWNHEKMAKSTGNFLTIKAILDRHHAEVIRYFLISSQYRSPLQYSEDNLKSARSALSRLYIAIRPYTRLLIAEDNMNSIWLERFNAAMNDDFNTPLALSILFEMSHELNKKYNDPLAQILYRIGGVLGLFNEKPDVFLQYGIDQVQQEWINQLISERQLARHTQHWAKADAIRAELMAAGIELSDDTQGTSWRVI